MTCPSAAWKHRLSSAGNVQDLSPNDLGRTPANIKSGEGPQYDASQLARVCTDDLDAIVNQYTIPAPTTGRSSHLFQYNGLSVATLASVFNLINFGHIILGQGSTVHRIKTYIWNETSGLWEEIANTIGSDDPRSQSGSAAGPTFSDYFDGSNRLFILAWDFEGVYNNGGAGGCVHGDSQIHTPGGLIAISDLIPGDIVLIYGDGAEEQSMVKEVTRHRKELWALARLNTTLGSVVLTDDHTVPVLGGHKPAGEVTTADELWSVGGNWIPVDSVDHYTEECEVYDVICTPSNILMPTISFFLDGGIGVNVMDR